MILKKSQISPQNEKSSIWVSILHHFGSLLVSFFDAFLALIFGSFLGCHFFDYLSKIVPQGIPKRLPGRRSLNHRTRHGSDFRSKTASGAFWLPFRILFSVNLLILEGFGHPFGSSLALFFLLFACLFPASIL